MASRLKKDEEPQPKSRPVTTPQARENHMINLAIDLAEQKLRDGTASAQIHAHYLKLASSRERLEQEKLTKENELLQAKADAIASAAKVEELMTEAISAFRSYAGQNDGDHA